MKQVTRFRLHPTFGTFLTAAGLLIAGESIAQEYALLTTKPGESAKPKAPAAARPYWKMATEPGADSTTVEFYQPDNAFVYAEKLPNKALKLTKQTIRTMNETMERLTATNAPTPAANTVADALGGHAGPLQIGTYASRDGIHLNLMIENPARDYVVIELLDKDQRTVYQTSTREDKPHFKFNLDGMPAGNYQLRVLGKKQHFERDLTFDYATSAPVIPAIRMAIK